MKSPKRSSLSLYTLITLVALSAALLAACGGSERASSTSGSTESATVQVKGSDTMVNVAQAWAEEYAKVDPTADVEVSGGGSGVGIAALERGTIDIANASREMKPAEIEQTKKNTGKEPKDFIVGYDGLAVYVHKDNPLTEISIEDLAKIYVETGTVTKWSEIGVTIPGVDDDTIVRVSRQSSSGTYEFFREHVLDKHDFKLGSRDMNGSKEVVELVGTTKTAIGYSGMGYATGEVKMLRIASTKGAPAVEPTIENTMSKAYPLARSLHLYTLGEPAGSVKRYIDWILSPDGQRVLADNGYVPLTPAAPAATPETSATTAPPADTAPAAN